MIRITERDLHDMVCECVKRVITEMTAYHGSAAQFNAFNLSNAHSGEGGTMYGFGVYVTTNPDTAKYYARVAKDANQRNEAYFYQVEIPDDLGNNYLNIEHNSPQVYDAITQGLCQLRPDATEAIQYCMDYCKNNDTLMWLFQTGCEYTFNEQELAELLSQMGYVGVKVPVGYQDAGMGQTEGYNYTIFSDKNVRIVNTQRL